jgi:uncharacterized protein
VLETLELIDTEAPTNGSRPSRNEHAPPASNPDWLPWLGAAVLGAGLAGLWSLAVEPRWLAVTRREVRLPLLPRALDGLRIAHLSDFHMSSLVSERFLHACVRTASEAQPDLAVVTGDYITRAGHWLDRVTPVLSGLRARLGVFATLGNHDHYAYPDQVAAAVEAAGIPCLRNQSVRLRTNGTEFWLIGLDSLHFRQYMVPERLYREVAQRMRGYLDQALTGVDPDAFRLMLAHSPDIMPDAVEEKIDLVLSGHTHGGQVRFPLVGATVCPSRYGTRYAAGLYREGRTTLYVNRGLGTVRFPVRFLCRPELALLTLRRG